MKQDTDVKSVAKRIVKERLVLYSCFNNLSILWVIYTDILHFSASLGAYENYA